MIHSTLNLSKDVRVYKLSIDTWKHREVYEAAEEWLIKHCIIGYFNHEYGTAIVNNKMYSMAVCFVNDTDYLIFKLKFPELCL